MGEAIRIYATVTRKADNCKHRVAVAVSSKKFKTVSDVQYHVLSLLDIDVGNSTVEVSLGKYLLPSSEPSSIFKDEDSVSIVIAPINRRSDKGITTSHIKEKEEKERKSSRPKTTASPPSKRLVISTSSVLPTKSVPPSDTMDVSNIWLQMKSSNAAPINAPTKKRKWPQNNDELLFNCEKNQNPSAEDAIQSYQSVQNQGRRKSNVEKQIETKTNYNLLPVVKTVADLMVGDEIVFKYVTLCEKTFTPALSHYLKAKTVSVVDATVTVDILKVDRFEKQYTVGQRVTFPWNDWGEVRMLKKFVPPLPPGPPPVGNGSRSSAVSNGQIESTSAALNCGEEEEVEESLFSLFSDDLQRKKAALSA